MDTAVDDLRNFNRHIAVFETADGLDDDFIGTALGIVLMKLDMRGTFDVGPDWW
jgi:hypothetical protein